ncbi:MAG: AAA family ATPase [Lachnospiraceae bacterium]|nr:AAA family ATPase [Lachnospiraceae bacterium]
MKKKIYAVRKGRAPGIYDVWAETERQVKGFRGAEYRSFTYMTEKEAEDETVEMSFSHARKRAEEYLKGILKEEKQVKELPEEAYDEKAALKKETESASNRMVLALAGLEADVYGNSPWITALLESVSGEKSYVNTVPYSPIAQTYSGRYSCTSLYTALLYLILDEDKILGAYQTGSEFSAGFETDDDCVQDIWHKSEDYIRLKRRFEDYEMEAVDLPEILNRNREKVKNGNRLTGTTESYLALKRFIKQGGHTVMGLYRELVGNPVYRRELLEISGPFRNPDLETAPHAEEDDGLQASMQDIVMQTSAVGMKLTERVVGQNDVVDKLEKSYFHAEKTANEDNKRKGPRNVYLFAGPPGVGKTFIAEIIADTLGIPYKRFDMSGYADKDTVTELMGSSTLYKDSKPGVLTSFVCENPRCVLLFDEVEKACREVILLFLQILDEGKCFDRHYDKDIDFRKTIVILTTNAGKQLYRDAGDENLTQLPDTVILDALKKDTDPRSNVPFFPPEMISRMSAHTVIMFNHLRAGAILKIIKTDLDKQLRLFHEKYGYEVDSEKDKLAATALYSMGGSMDARNATVFAGKLLDGELYEFLKLTEEKMGLDWRGRIRKITWEHDFTGASDEIRQFYLGKKDCVIAIFGRSEEIRDQRLIENHVRIKITTDPEEFMRIIRTENVILTAVDYEYGMKEKEKGLSLNIADSQTGGSRIFSDIRKEDGELPVYILYGDEGHSYSQREKRALYRRGAKEFIRRENIRSEILEAYTDVCCQQTMETLSQRRQRLAYDVRKELDEKQKSGRIIFCHFKLESAVETEDKDLLLSADMRPDRHWEDIFVSDDVKNELKYFIDFLNKPKEYMQKGGRPPKGVLLCGPAGTGKTSLAKVVAAESGVNFLEVGGDVLAAKGADEVHRIFCVARKYAPAVLFFDEVDAVGKDRTTAGVSITLNALLQEMDGFRRVNHKPVFVMAATNMEQRRLDPAFLKRFDRTLFIDIPGKAGRKWMLERLIREDGKRFCVSEREIDSLVDRSEGMSLAYLENMMEAAKREAIRADKSVDDILLDEVFEKLNLGEAREVSSLEELKRTAYHEAGHALIQLFHKKVPVYMSIVARGSFGGYVNSVGKCFTKESLLERICMCLGGRAAEIVCGYGITLGAASDLENATALAEAMVCRYGMYEEEMGLAVVSKEDLPGNEKAKNLINRILSGQLKEAVAIIRDNKEALERLVKAVMDSEKKFLTRKEIEAAYNGSGSLII